MHFPLIPKAEAMELLESAQHADESRGEMLAELGSSYYCGGMSAGDATFLASAAMAQAEADFRSSEDGEIYFARLEAAKLYEGVTDASLSEWDIPEFVDGKTSYAHSPFAPSSYRPTPDDIPF